MPLISIPPQVTPLSDTVQEMYLTVGAFLLVDGLLRTSEAVAVYQIVPCINCLGGIPESTVTSQPDWS